MVEQCLEILEIQQQQAFAIRHLERRIQRRLLAVGELQQAAQQQRPHFAQGGAQRMTGLAMDIPQGHGIGLGPVVEPGHAGNPLGDLALGIARGAQPAEIALDVRGEDRHPGIAESLRQALQGDGLAGTGSARHQAMAVGQAHGLGDRLAVEAGADDELR